MNNIIRRTNNPLASPSKYLEGCVLKNAASSNIFNDRIKTCDVCKNNGYPHEAIMFEKVLGRVLSHGSYETKSWIIRDYFTGQIHCHRSSKLKKGLF